MPSHPKGPKSLPGERLEFLIKKMHKNVIKVHWIGGTSSAAVVFLTFLFLFCCLWEFADVWIGAYLCICVQSLYTAARSACLGLGSEYRNHERPSCQTHLCRIIFPWFLLSSSNAVICMIAALSSWCRTLWIQIRQPTTPWEHQPMDTISHRYLLP